MVKNRALSVVFFVASSVTGAAAQDYPPLSEYLMDKNEEIAMARTAAPNHISSKASVMVLTNQGFTIAEEGENGFLCMVLRGFSAPTYSPKPMRNFVYASKLRAPICYDRNSARDVFPLQQLKTKLGIQGMNPDEIGKVVAEAYVTGKLPRLERVSFAYMMSGHQNLNGEGNQFKPHMMVYAPWYDNKTLGGNPMGGALPFVLDDDSTPFTVVTIPGDGVEFNWMNQQQ